MRFDLFDSFSNDFFLPWHFTFYRKEQNYTLKKLLGQILLVTFALLLLFIATGVLFSCPDPSDLTAFGLFLGVC